MAFIINEQKQVFGMTVNSLYCRVIFQVGINGEIHASPMLYVNKEAYEAEQPLRHQFDVVDLKQKYNEADGLPLGEYIEIPISKELSAESVYVGLIENKAENYLQMTMDKVIDHLVKIKFISDKINIEIV